MRIDFEKIKKYQEKFFSGDSLESYSKENFDYVAKIKNRSKLLLEGKLIFDDAMDMEACSIPYEFEQYRWNSYPGADPEWLYMMSRHGFMLDLAICYRLEQKPEFLELWKTLLFDFIEKNSKPTDDNPSSWRPLDAGLRLMNWLKSLLYLPLDSLFDEKEKESFAQAIQIHCNYAKESFIEKYLLSNWGILSLSGLAMMSLLADTSIEESTKLSQWTWSKFEMMLDLQFFQDGIHWEQSPLYQHEVLMILSNLLQVSEYLEVSLPFPFRERLKPLVEASFYQADSSDILNPIHDSDQVDFSYVYHYYRLLGFLPKAKGQEASLLLAGNQFRGKDLPKLPPIFSEKDSGFLAYKGSDVYFTLLNGWHGSSHGHASTGSFTFQLGKTPLLMDCGRYLYTETPLRLSLKEEKSHNTLACHESSGTKITGSWTYGHLVEPLQGRMYKTPLGFYASCSWHNNQETLQVFTRQFLYLEEIQVLVILDTSQGFKEKMEGYFHYDSLLKVHKISEKDFLIEDGNRKFRHWSSSKDTRIEEMPCSKIYNQSSLHSCIVAKTNLKKSENSKDSTESSQILSVIGEDSFSISEISVTQTGSEKMLVGAGGIRICAKNKKYDIFYMQQDILHGNKLLKSEFGQYFYGRLVVFDEQGKRIKIA